MQITQDNPYRVASPGDLPGELDAMLRAEWLDERIDHHHYRVKTMVVAVLAGHVDSCMALDDDKYQKLDASDLYSAITDDADPVMLARSLAVRNWEAKNEWQLYTDERIDAFVAKTASYLANRELDERESGE